MSYQAPLLRFLLVVFAGCLFSTVKSGATGGLFVRPLNSSQTYDLMTIKTYDATVDIQDQIASTHIDQVFFNHSTARVEATYIFPLPEGAVITELIYWFNGKQYKASLRESKAAQQAYNDKIRQYLDPALLQELGDNVFKLNIAPIDPQSEVRFEITYSELLPYEFGMVGYRFPLRTTGLSPEPLQRVSVKVDATSSSDFTVFESPSHGNTAENQIVRKTARRYEATYGDELFLPEQDYLLRFATARGDISMNILTYTPAPEDSMGADSFSAMWITPPDSTGLTTLPRNIVIATDISSSMEGERLQQLKDAMHVFLDGMTENDKFNIIPFSTNVVSFRSDLVQATPATVKDARLFVDKLGAAGLTNIDAVVQYGLGMSYDADATKIFILVTDGYPTWGEMNEQAIVKRAHDNNISNVKVFTFGIGDEVSKSLMTSLALDNGGYPSFVSEFDSIPSLVRNFFTRVSRPVLSNVSIDYGGLHIYDIYPAQLPDLFWGSQVLQFGRYRNGGIFPVELGGHFVADTFSLVQQVNFGSEHGGVRAVARLWARQKIDFLLHEIAIYGEKKELVDAVIDLSLRYGVLTPYTAFYSDPTDPTSVHDQPGYAAENGLMVEPCYPNPTTGPTVLRFVIPDTWQPQTVAVVVYDEAGKVVRHLLQGELSPGAHSVAWDGADDAGQPVVAGRYFLRIESRNGSVGGIVVVLNN